MELSCRNSLRVKATGCFRGEDPSLLELIRPNSPDSHQTQIQENEILY